MPHSGRFVAYYRVSTTKQGQSGLGLDAQRVAVRDYLNGGNWALAGEHTEVESGKDAANRPALAAALRDCDLLGATLVIAKLDRLSRNAAFLMTLQDSGVAFVCADMPEANRLTIGLLAVIAQHEREQISQRTKVALAAAKARGKRLGGWRGGPKIDVTLGTAAQVARSNAYAARVGPLAAELHTSGMSLRQVGAELARRGVRTMRGGEWTADAVKRLLDRHAGKPPTTVAAPPPAAPPLSPPAVPLPHHAYRPPVKT
jgi:DNA invertase Pin-like site-specific DNA recombinase